MFNKEEREAFARAQGLTKKKLKFSKKTFAKYNDLAKKKLKGLHIIGYVVKLGGYIYIFNIHRMWISFSPFDI
jgi:hypothetical protein